MPRRAICTTRNGPLDRRLSAPRHQKPGVRNQNANRRFSDFWLLISGFWSPSRPPGGARRDRTDDLMLAKHALSQLSYGPAPEAQKSEYGEQRTDRRRSFYRILRTPDAMRQAKLYCIGQALEAVTMRGFKRRSVLRPPSSVLRLVEPDGIEPTTSCLQSTRSPN